MRRLNRLNSVSTNLFIKRLVKELLIHLEIIVYINHQEKGRKLQIFSRSPNVKYRQFTAADD